MLILTEIFQKVQKFDFNFSASFANAKTSTSQVYTNPPVKNNQDFKEMKQNLRNDHMPEKNLQNVFLVSIFVFVCLFV